MGSNSNPSSTRKSEERAAFARQDSCAADGPFSPAGLKVLVVDDDPMCLKVVSAMLQRCNYEVETKNNGQDALALLRQRQEEGQQFDLVLSDVYMPDVDGFKLLESIGLELEVPVIMMSSDGDTNVVLRGVTHGAVDFLIKPVRIEELKNVWQHVVRRRSVHHARPGEEGAEFEGDSRTYGASGASGQGTKRKDTEPLRVEHEGGSGSKKPRVIWSVEMHQQFVNAVNALGIDKAVPKRILELMNVEGLTRENVASHLQKYRLYLKRVEGVATGKGGKLPRNTPGMMSAGVSGGQGMYHDASTMDEGSLRGGGDAAACIGAGGGGGGGGGSSIDPNSAADLSQSAAAAAAAQQHHQAAAAYHQGAAAAAAAAAGYPPGMATTGQVAAAHMAAWQHQQMAMHAHAVAAAAMGGAPPGAHPFGIPHAAAANPYAAAAAMHHHHPPGSAPNPTAYGMPPHPPGAFCAPTGGVMHHHGPAVASYGAAPPQHHHHQQQQQHHAGSATASHSSAFPPTSTPHNTNPHGGHPHPHQHQHHSHMPSSAHGCSAAGGVVDGSGYASGSNTNGNGGGGAPSGHKNNHHHHHHHNNTNNTTNTNVGGQGNGNGSTNGSNFNGGSLGGANFTPNGGGNGSGRDSPDTVPMPFPGGGGGGGGVSCGHACCAGGGATSFLERAATDKKNGGKDAAYTCIHDQYGHHHHHGDFASGDPGAGGEAFLPPLAEGFLPPMDDVPGLGHLKEDPEGEFINMFIQGMEGVQGPGSTDGPDVVERGH